MESQAKLALVIRAIEESRRITRKEHQVRVYISTDTGLGEIYPQELKDILLKLQDDEGIIRIKSFPDWLLPNAYHLTKDSLDSQVLAKLDPSRKHFVVDILDSYWKWYANYWVESALQSDIKSVINQFEKQPKLFLESLQEAGRSWNSIRLVEKLLPDCTQEEIDYFFDTNLGEIMDVMFGIDKDETTRQTEELSKELDADKTEDLQSGEVPPADSLVRRRKPSWTKTNVPWDTRKLIWQSWAKGSTISDIQSSLELSEHSLDRKTIGNVMDELRRLPAEIEKTLITELPEVESLIKEQKANLNTKPK